jgi:hypothetical protein
MVRGGSTCLALIGLLGESVTTTYKAPRRQEVEGGGEITTLSGS